MSIELLEAGAEALGPLTGEVVFVGAAALALCITDEARPPLRPTVDVDVIVEVLTRGEFYAFEQRLRARDFQDDQGMLGRFRFPASERILDAIPADASLLGFENRWQRESLADVVLVRLPSGATIRTLPAVNLLATKLEAFAGRGDRDFLGSKDFEDIVSLIDGRAELAAEARAAAQPIRTYLASEMTRHLEDPRCEDALAAHLEYGGGGRARAEKVLIPRVREVIAAG